MNNFIEIEYIYEYSFLPEKFSIEHSLFDYRTKNVHHAIINLDLIQGINPYRYTCKDENDEIKLIQHKIIYSNIEYIITDKEFERIKDILFSKKDLAIL